MGTKPTPQDLVAIKANLDKNGGLPEQIHHPITKGSHPELRVDVANLVGVSAKTHDEEHRHGVDREIHRISLEDIW